MPRAYPVGTRKTDPRHHEIVAHGSGRPMISASPVRLPKPCKQAKVAPVNEDKSWRARATSKPLGGYSSDGAARRRRALPAPKIEQPRHTSRGKLRPASAGPFSSARKCERPPRVGTAFPLSANAACSGEQALRGGGQAHELCRARHMTMRHQTTSFPLLNDKADVGAAPLRVKPCSRHATGREGSSRPAVRRTIGRAPLQPVRSRPQLRTRSMTSEASPHRPRRTRRPDRCR